MSNENLVSTNYRAMIPFHVLLDLDLTVAALRMYGIIEQMESATGKVFFSIPYLAKQLGLKERQTQRVAKSLRDKGYLEHIEHKPGRWLWRTKKNYPEERIDEGCHGKTPGGVTGRHPGVSPDDTHTTKVPKTNIQTTTSGSVASQSREEDPPPSSVIDPDTDAAILATLSTKNHDAKDDHQYLLWCQYWMQHHCKAGDSEGKIRVLMSIIKKSPLTQPDGFSDAQASTPAQGVSDDIYEHQSYLMCCAGDIKRGLVSNDFKPLGFKEWLASGKPKKISSDILNSQRKLG